MPTLGAVTVEILRGNTAPQTQRVDVWHVPGRSGIGAQLMGLNQSGFSYVAVLYGVEADVEARLASISGLQGTVITITDDFARARGSCLVTSVGIPSRKEVVREGVVSVRAQVQVQGVRTT